MKSIRICLAAFALLPLAVTAQSDYPSKSITLVVPFTAGGPTDKIARDLAEVVKAGRKG